MDCDLIKRLLARLPDPARAYKSDATIARNPDGPDAAARIAELETEKARLREAVIEALDMDCAAAAWTILRDALATLDKGEE